MLFIQCSNNNHSLCRHKFYKVYRLYEQWWFCNSNCHHILLPKCHITWLVGIDMSKSKSTGKFNLAVVSKRMIISWWRHQMETFSALLAICAGKFSGPGEFPAQRPVTRSFDVFFDLRLNKRMSKQSRGWWFETLSRQLWRHRNVWSLSYRSAVRYARLLTKVQLSTTD